MADIRRKARPIPVILVSVIIWGSSAVGLPAEAPAEEGEGTAVEDVWAGVRVSDAYSYLECPRCYYKNDLRAARCARCGLEFPQPSPDVTDPSMVFVPGKGYYREGTLLEPAASRKGLWITGLVVAGCGLVTMEVATLLAADEELFGDGDTTNEAIAFIAGSAITVTGAVLIIVGLTNKTPPIYAFRSAEHTDPAGRGAFARRSRDDDARLVFAFEMPVWGF